jgi:tol-pal system protein YbgF
MLADEPPRALRARAIVAHHCPAKRKCKKLPGSGPGAETNKVPSAAEVIRNKDCTSPTKEVLVKRNQIAMLLGAAMLAGALGGTLFSPAPVGAVAKEIIELMGGVTQLQQGQRDIQSSINTNQAVLKTLIEQQADSVSKLNAAIGSMQKTMQDLQANSGAQLSSMTTQVQGVSDNMGDIQQRLSKLNQQIADIQSSLQSLDAKISGAAPAATNPNTGSGTPGGTSSTPGNSGGGAAGGAPSAETLYSGALHDIQTAKYDLARQEFTDYLKYYPGTDYASNAVFYLGEIAFVQQRFQDAVEKYTEVLSNYPKSFKLGPSLYKRGVANLQLGKRTAGISDLRETIRRFPNSDEEKLARSKLKEMNVPVAGR